ncbi:MAG: hydrogenase maturation nickel metallochaperone HypA [Trichlorobacter sp.]|nr:hydrogenase maturation nickel metallochaperone HypA [Trichlorobacter sp.]
MHELSLVKEIVDLCEQHANGKQVVLVVLEIGALSNVITDAIEFCFSACIADTLLAGANLEIVTIDGKGRCLDCGKEQNVHSYYEPCCFCRSFKVKVTAGDEMRVLEIEVAD